MKNSVYSTPVPANGVLFLNNRNELFALAEKPVANNSKPAPATVGGN